MLNLKKYNVEPILHNTPIADAQISPDGEKVLFVRWITNIEEDKYETHIWSVPG